MFDDNQHEMNVETKMFLKHCWNPAECVCNWMSIEVKKNHL